MNSLPRFIGGRMLSPDNYVQMPDFTQNFNRYSYCLNNPLIYTDPSGDFIFTALALLIPGGQAFLPIAIGTDIGWITGGIRGAKTPGMTFLNGAWRGGLSGAIGGTLAMTGGGTFLNNVLWGGGSGAFTGGINALLWGDDVRRGVLIGGLAGMGFASINSGIEAYKNYRDYNVFKTDEGTFRYFYNKVGELEYIDDKVFGNTKEAYKTINYWLDRNYGNLNKEIALSNINENKEKLLISVKSFNKSYQQLKYTLAHEIGHQNNIFTDPTITSLYGNDGIEGYQSAIQGSGHYHIPYRVIAGLDNTGIYVSQAWQEYGFSKWFNLIPRRSFFWQSLPQYSWLFRLLN